MGYSLTIEEANLSKAASKRLGYAVLIYRDGNWKCDPTGKRFIGYGDTPEAAEADCKQKNGG